jgi:hypothetical protein
MELEKNAQTGASCFVCLFRHRSVDYIKKNKGVRGACYLFGGEVHSWSCWGLLKKGDHLENVGLEGRIILK